MELREHQLKAIDDLDNGKILWGGVGTGKTATVIGYYLKKEAPRNIYVITTAKKRDSLDWEKEASSMGVGVSPTATLAGTMVVDSWNNIKKYVDIDGAFFIFDEQRLVGRGAWVKAFLKIAKKNRWVILSATPGDTWLDYAPVFIANGYFKNITDFKFKHVVYEPFSRFPKIRMYVGERKLELLRNEVLVEMPFAKHTERMLNWMEVDHDKEMMKRVTKDRWHVYEDRPIKDVSEMFRVMRKVVNSDPDRLQMVKDLLKLHPKLIIFYNFDYELEMLRTLDAPIYEWNGHKKDPLPEEDEWVYLVQYIAGAEGWNCTSTNAMCLYSMTYSYKNFEQAQGRIDRINTEYSILYYYILMSNSVIDSAIKKCLVDKHSFNEKKFVREEGVFEAEFDCG